IRDRTVTGVQTCALPIWRISEPRCSRLSGSKPRLASPATVSPVRRAWENRSLNCSDESHRVRDDQRLQWAALLIFGGVILAGGKIGRASCRERGGGMEVV